jgi:hypothetical protein
VLACVPCSFHQKTRGGGRRCPERSTMGVRGRPCCLKHKGDPKLWGYRAIRGCFTLALDFLLGVPDGYVATTLQSCAYTAKEKTALYMVKRMTTCRNGRLLIAWRTGKTCFDSRLQLIPSSPIPTQEHAARGEPLLTASTPKCHSFDSSLAHLRHLGTLEPRATFTTLS